MALENPANSVEDSPHVSKGFSWPCVTHVEKSPFLETKPNSPTRARASSPPAASLARAIPRASTGHHKHLGPGDRRRPSQNRSK